MKDTILLFLLSLAALSWKAGTLAGQEQAGRDPAESEQRENESEQREKAQRLEEMATAAGKYVLKVGEDNPIRAELVKTPVFRWTNPIRKSLDGGLFIWTADGRPQALVGIFTRTGRHYQFEFQSLAEGPLYAERLDRPVWHPDKAGVRMTSFHDAPTVGDSEKLRLRQMRSLARGFTARLKLADRPPEELRLLPRSIYRYSSPKNDILDGALFVYAQGTDPEVMLLVEARQSEDGPRWHYGFARVTWAPVEAQLGDEIVWSVEYWDRVSDPTRPYVVFKGMSIP